MDIAIKVKPKELAESGMDESSLLEEIIDRLEGDSDCKSSLPGYGVTIVQLAAMEVSEQMPQRCTMKVPGFILTHWDDISKKQCYFFSAVEMPQYGHTTVCPYTLEFDLPEGRDAKTAALEGIKTQQAALEIDFAVKKQALELRMQTLMENN